MSISLHDNEFQLPCKGGVARLKIRPVDKRTLNFYSTFVPPQSRGGGVGASLVCHGLDWARQGGYRVVPGCPYVQTVVKRYPEYRDLLSEDT